MSKSIKLKNDTYISDLGIVHNRQILKEKIDSIDNELQDHKTRLQNQEIRSTSEQVVGKWIDGKPIYRKVITGLNTSTGYRAWAENATLNVPLQHLIKATFLRAYNTTNYGEVITPREIKWSDNKIYSWDTYSDGNINVIIVEYTKTTDRV